MTYLNLDILAQCGYFVSPEYYFTEKHNKDGTPLWHCKCSIKDKVSSYTSNSPFKKTAKRKAAYQMHTERKEQEFDFYSMLDDDYN